MNKIKTLIIMVIFFGLIASPAAATCILPDADFFYDVAVVDAQNEISMSDGPIKADLKGKKAASTLPGDILTPENFYGYSDQIPK